VIIDLLVDGPIGLAAGKLADALSRRRLARALNIGCGAIFAGLAVRLVLVD
jgi:threonine/homoserine/homoserine lactone efflux protein